MALSNVEGRRCPHPSSLRRTGKYDSLLGISGALYLSVFEQPASRVFFSILLDQRAKSKEKNQRLEPQSPRDRRKSKEKGKIK